MEINPTAVAGAWRCGWTLDQHTIASQFQDGGGRGHARYDTTRSPIGELLYQLKYRGQATAPQVAKVMADFFSDMPTTLEHIDMIIPVPPSSDRSIQPLELVAREMGIVLKKPVLCDAVRKVRDTPSLKNIEDPEERRELLDGAFKARAVVKRKSILLVDDLYRSGATANAVTSALMSAGASRVYFLAATRTRNSS